MAIVIVFLAGVQLTIHDTRNWIYYTDTAGFSQEAADTIRAFELGFGLGSWCSGIGCQPNQQLARHRWLLRNLTNDELLWLSKWTYHPKTKAIAYEGLLHKKQENLYRLLRRAMREDELVYLSSGCTGELFTIAGYVLSKTIGLPNAPPSSPNTRTALNLSKEEVEAIREIYFQMLKKSKRLY